MNKKFLIIGSFALAVIALVFLFSPFSKKKTSKSSSNESDVSESSSTGGGFSNFSDAPNPNTENPALDSETERLWPHLAKQDTSDARKEKVREEWNNFAAKYPKNFYIPAELKAPLTETEIVEKRKEIDIVAKMDAKLAVLEIGASKMEPGSTVPKAPSKPDITPEEQRIYISYKTRELESRIQLIEYSIENSGINGDQITIARKDIVGWQKQLTDLQNVEKKIPNS